MIDDPYKVLGVEHGASQDEIKQAYRRKAKECHPDLHPDDPKAAEKMNQVNQAYDMLQHPEKYQGRQQNSSAGNSSYYQQHQGGWQQSGWDSGIDFESMFGFGPRTYYYSPDLLYPQEMPSDSAEMRRAVREICARMYQNALSRLDAMPAYERNGRWYYLSALAHYGMGNTMTASELINKATQMDPGNAEYLRLLDLFRRTGQTYRSNASGFNTNAVSMDKLCFSLCAAQFLCYFCRCC